MAEQGDGGEGRCPKRMVFGPCGGVRPGGGCEVDDHPCPFALRPLVRWPGPVAGEADAPWRATPSGVVVTDLHVRPRDLAGLRRVAAALAGTCDAVLAGDHGGARNDFPPSFVAAELLAAGVTPWVTLSCRDRNRVALGAECAALAELGVAGVHCVTGDWQGITGAGDERKVFDLDALRLVDMARSYGLTVSVAATPAAPPLSLRPDRLAEKVKAGAQLCFVNHAGGPGPVAGFVRRAREAGADIPYLACVPVVSDLASVATLASLPGLVLDRSVVERVARDRVVGDGTAAGSGAARAGVAAAAGEAAAAGVAAAAGEAAAMLAIDGVVGVNLSGSASAVSQEASAAIMGELGRVLRG